MDFDWPTVEGWRFNKVQTYIGCKMRPSSWHARRNNVTLQKSLDGMFEAMRGHVSVSLAHHTPTAPATKPDLGYECITFLYPAPMVVAGDMDEIRSELSIWEQLRLETWGEGKEVA